MTAQRDERPGEKGFKRRWIAVCVVVAALLLAMLFRVAQFQLVEAGSYVAPTVSASSSTQAQESL